MGFLNLFNGKKKEDSDVASRIMQYKAVWQNYLEKEIDKLEGHKEVDASIEDIQDANDSTGAEFVDDLFK